MELENIEKQVKEKLISRGFSEERLLNNRGLIGATVIETLTVFIQEDIKQKYKKETNQDPYCCTKTGQRVKGGSYSDDYVKWMESKLT